MIPVAKPYFSNTEKKNLSTAINSAWISSKGRFIDEFEAAFAKKYKAKFAIALSNCTSALHLALVACGVGPGDEVIVPNLTFISSSNAVVHAGATPVFVDVEKHTWNIDPYQVEKRISAKTKAIMPVHIYGHPADMSKILKIARKHSLKVIEDCAEAQGAKVNNKFVGTLGDVGCFSFFGNKIMTTGEGGMCLTNSKTLANTIRLYRSHGMDPKKRYFHPVVGYNYRMTNMQAAVGLGQLSLVDKFISRREKIRSKYESGLRELINEGKIKTMPKEKWAKPVCWFFSILVEPSKRNKLIAHLEKNGIETRPFFPPITSQRAYKTHKKTVSPISQELSRRGINLPTFFELKDKEIKTITELIKDFLK